MTVEGSADPGGEPSGPQDDLDSKLGVPLLRLVHTTREPPQVVADKLEKQRRESGRLGISDKGIPIPEGATISDEVLDHIECVAGVYVRDTVAHLYRQMKAEQREWFCSKIPSEGGEPLGIIQKQNITRELLEQFRLRARSREDDHSRFDIASVVDLSKPLFSVRTRVSKSKTEELDNSELLEALQWMDSVDQPESESGERDMVSKEESQLIWEYAGAPIGYLAQRGLLHPDDHKNLLDGIRKEFPSPDAAERKHIVTRARALDQIAVEAAIMDFELDHPDTIEVSDRAPIPFDFDAIEHRAGPAVRDLVEKLYERMNDEDIEAFHRKLDLGPFGSPLKPGERESRMGLEQQEEILHDLTGYLHLVRNPVKDREGYLAFVDDVGHEQSDSEMAARKVYVVRPPRMYDPKPAESSKLVLFDSADGDIDEDMILGAKTEVLEASSGRITKIGDIPARKTPEDPDKTPVAGMGVNKPRTTPVVPQPPMIPKPPVPLTKRASKEPQLDLGESTDLANSLVGVPPAVDKTQDSSQGSVRAKRKLVDTDDESVPPGPLPGPITSRFNREEILSRSSQLMDASPASTPVAPSEPPKPSLFKRFMRFVFWVVLILVLAVLGAYIIIDTLVGDVPSRWDKQVSVASITSLFRSPPPKPAPVIIPLGERPLIMVDGAEVSQVRERWVVTVPLRKQIERPVLMIDEQVQLSFIVERSKDESTLRYIGSESQMIGDMIHLRVLLRAPMDLDVREIDIYPYLVE